MSLRYYNNPAASRINQQFPHPHLRARVEMDFRLLDIYNLTGPCRMECNQYRKSLTYPEADIGNIY